MRLAIVGGGVMGEAILTSALACGLAEPGETSVAEVVASRRAELAERHGVRVTGNAAEAMAGSDFVVLSVKPQDLKSVEGAVPAEAVLCSIMAGVRIATLEADFGHDRIVRVMPNTPAAIGAGMSAWTATAAVSDEQRAITRTLLASFGSELYVDDEKKIDMATALSGSGPAYVFLFLEAMIEGGVSVGLPRAQAEEMALQTVLGAAQYAKQSGKSAAELRAMVTSPAGTTAAGLLELEKGAMRAVIIECVRAAHRRAVELGGPPA